MSRKKEQNIHTTPMDKYIVAFGNKTSIKIPMPTNKNKPDKLFKILRTFFNYTNPFQINFNNYTQ